VNDAARQFRSYTTDANVLLESVRAAVIAYGEGKITEKEWPKPSPYAERHTKRLRAAPSFIVSLTDTIIDHPYTATTLGVFLGMTKKGGNAAEGVQQKASSGSEI
jgi:hypothetical protein